jgi:hypothetical protein
MEQPKSDSPPINPLPQRSGSERSQWHMMTEIL